MTLTSASLGPVNESKDTGNIDNDGSNPDNVTKETDANDENPKEHSSEVFHPCCGGDQSIVQRAAAESCLVFFAFN